MELLKSEVDDPEPGVDEEQTYGGYSAEEAK